MKLYATVTSERASKGQGGNEFLELALNVYRNSIGRIELQYHNDTEDGEDVDEWVLLYYPAGSEDGDIIAQGHVKPDTCKCGTPDGRIRCRNCEKAISRNGEKAKI